MGEGHSSLSRTTSWISARRRESSSREKKVASTPEGVGDSIQDGECEWPDVVFYLVDVAGRQPEGVGQGRLGEVAFAAELFEARSNVGFRHGLCPLCAVMGRVRAQGVTWGTESAMA